MMICVNAIRRDATRERERERERNYSFDRDQVDTELIESVSWNIIHPHGEYLPLLVAE
jgi:hypothetical protein